jgi:signal transduction histidine kinase
VSQLDPSLAKRVHGLLEAASARYADDVEAALARLVEGLGVERITVFGYAEETRRLIALYHAVSPGSAAPPELIDAALVPHAIAALQHGGRFAHEQPSAIPEEDRAGFALLGVRSVLGLPVALGPSSIGCIAFEMLSAERRFEPELEWFAAAARIVEDTLARQRTRAEEESARARAEFELGELLAAFLGHDLRNPLSAISGLTQLVLRREGLPDDVLRRVSAIDAALTRTNQWIGTLLDFLESRGHDGLELHRTPIDLAELSSRVIREQVATRPDRPITLESSSAAPGVWDPARLAQLLLHVLANAQSSSEGSEPVRVQLAADASSAVLSVRSQGTPLTAEAMQSLFDPFGRLTPPESSRPRSLRLGLYMARRIAESHGGSLSVESSPEGGTVFTVRLPANGG